MNNDLLILGAGQLGTMAKEIAENMGCFGKIDFLDDSSDTAIGKLNDYERFAQQYNYGIVAIGNAEMRLNFIQKLKEACYRVAILVSPKAYVSPSAQILSGTIIEPMATLQANSTVCIGCIISSGAVVRHNSFVGDGCHCDCNSVVMTGAIVPAKTKVLCGEIYSVEKSVCDLKREFNNV